ncbi:MULTISPECIES: spore germination lipoprotein GerD [Gracilibacillus]|uniref:spore germination lipoprotein GerD n=1 Tax=Gracilibacillus TaxID=74385 RepID=UPI0008263DD8|nr:MULTISPECIES: spore germination lipoprotein GerD [Gracilibacillus]
MYRFIYILLILTILAGCGGSDTEAQERNDYEGVKRMVTDILKTEEGKQAINEVLAADDMQQSYVIETKVVKEAVTEALSSEEGKQFWTKLFQDPTFIESFATTLQEKQTEVTQNLMSDSNYQKKMMEILSDPEMEKQTLTLLTSQQFREHLEKVVDETLQSPAFQARMAELIAQSSQNSQSGGGGGGENDEGVAGKSEEEEGHNEQDKEEIENSAGG